MLVEIEIVISFTTQIETSDEAFDEKGEPNLMMGVVNLLLGVNIVVVVKDWDRVLLVI